MSIGGLAAALSRIGLTVGVQEISIPGIMQAVNVDVDVDVDGF